MEAKYIIVKGISTEELVKEVELRIKEGLVPQGGITVANASNLIFAQAMVK